MPLPLETVRLIMRPFQDSDIATFAAYRSDPIIAQYQSWHVPYSVESATELVETMKSTRPGTPEAWYQVAIELKANPILIGDCAFCVLGKEAQQAEIGVTLAQDYHGKGYAIEALRKLFDYLFGELGLHRISAICDAENKASSKLLEKIGMRREAHFIENIWFKGKWGSEYVYGLLKKEWEIMNAPSPP